MLETVPFPSHAQWVAAAAAATPALNGNTLQARAFNDPCLAVLSHEPAVVAQGVGAAGGAGEADVASHSTFSLAATAVLTAATYRTLLLRTVGDLQPMLLPTLVFRQPAALRASASARDARSGGSASAVDNGTRVDVEMPIAAVARACGWAVEPAHVVGSGNPRPAPANVASRAGANSAGGAGPAIGGADVHLAAGARYTIRARLVVSVTHPGAFWGTGGGRDAGSCPRGGNATTATATSDGGSGQLLRGWTDLFLNGASVPLGLAPLAAAVAAPAPAASATGSSSGNASGPALSPPAPPRVYDDGQVLAALRGRTPVEPPNPSQSEPVFGTMTGVLAGGHWHTSLMAYDDVLQQLRAQCVRAHRGCEAACDAPPAAVAPFPVEPEPLLYRLLSGLAVDITVPPLSSLATPESDAAVPDGSLGLSSSPLVALLRALDVEDALALSQPTGVGASAAAAAAAAAVPGGNASTPAGASSPPPPLAPSSSAPVLTTPARGLLSAVAEALTNTRAYGSVASGASDIPRGVFMEEEGFFYPAVRGPPLVPEGGDAASDPTTRGWSAASLQPFAPPAAVAGANATGGDANATAVESAPLPLWANASVVGRSLAAACRAVAAQAAACLPLPASATAGAAAAYTGSVAFGCAYPVSPAQCDVTGATADLLATLQEAAWAAADTPPAGGAGGAGAGDAGALPASVAAYLAAVRAAASAALGGSGGSRSNNMSSLGLAACAAAVSAACEEYPRTLTAGYPVWANVTAAAAPSASTAAALGVPPLALFAAVLDEPGRALPAPPRAPASATTPLPGASRLWRLDTPPVWYLTRTLSIPAFIMNVPRSDVGDLELSLQVLPEMTGEEGGDAAAPAPALAVLAAARDAFATALQLQLQGGGATGGSAAAAANVSSAGGGASPRPPSVWQLRTAARAALLAVAAAPATSSLGSHAAKGRLVWARTGNGLGFTDVELAASVNFLPRGGDIGSRPAYPPHRIGYGPGGDAVVIARTSVHARGALLAALLCHASLTLAGVTRHRTAHLRLPLRLYAASPATAAQLLLPGSEVAAEALLEAAGASADDDETAAAAAAAAAAGSAAPAAVRSVAVGPARVSSSVDPPVWQSVQWSALARPHVFQPLLAAAALPGAANSSSSAGGGGSPWALVATYARASSSSPAGGVVSVSGNASLGLLLMNSLPTPVTVTGLRGVALAALARVTRTWVTTATSTVAAPSGGGTVTTTNTTTCRSAGVRRLALSHAAAASDDAAAGAGGTRRLTPLTGVTLSAAPATRLWSGVRGLGPRAVDRRLPSLQRRRFVPAPLRSLRASDSVPVSLLLQPDGSVAPVAGYAPLAAVAGATDMHPDDLLEGLQGGWILHLVLPAAVQVEPLPQAPAPAAAAAAGSGSEPAATADDGAAAARAVACTLATAVTTTTSPPAGGGPPTTTTTTTTTTAVDATTGADDLRLPFTRADDRALAGAGVAALATEAELSPSTDRARVRGASTAVPVPGGTTVSYAVELLPAVRNDAAGVPPALLHALPGAALQVRPQGLPALWLRLAPQPHGLLPPPSDSSSAAGSGDLGDPVAVAAAERAAIAREGTLTLSPLALRVRDDGSDGDDDRRRQLAAAAPAAPVPPLPSRHDDDDSGGYGGSSAAGTGSAPRDRSSFSYPAAAGAAATASDTVLLLRPSPAGRPDGQEQAGSHGASQAAVTGQEQAAAAPRRLPVVEASPGAAVGSTCLCAAATSPSPPPAATRRAGAAAAAPTVPPVTVDISTLSYELHPASIVFLAGLVLLDVLLCGWCVGDRACWMPRHRKLASSLAATSRRRRGRGGGCCACGGPCCVQLSLLCCGEPDACNCGCNVSCGRRGRGSDGGKSLLTVEEEGAAGVALAPVVALGPPAQLQVSVEEGAASTAPPPPLAVAATAASALIKAAAAAPATSVVGDGAATAVAKGPATIAAGQSQVAPRPAGAVNDDSAGAGVVLSTAPAAASGDALDAQQQLLLLAVGTSAAAAARVADVNRDAGVDNPFDQFHADARDVDHPAPAPAAFHTATALGDDPFHDMLFSTAGRGLSQPLELPSSTQQQPPPWSPPRASGPAAAAPSPFDHFHVPPTASSAVAPSPFDDFDSGFDGFSAPPAPAPSTLAASPAGAAPLAAAAAPQHLAEAFAQFDSELGGGDAGGDGGEPVATAAAAPSVDDALAAALQPPSDSHAPPPPQSLPAASTTVVDAASPPAEGAGGAASSPQPDDSGAVAPGGVAWGAPGAAGDARLADLAAPSLGDAASSDGAPSDPFAPSSAGQEAEGHDPFGSIATTAAVPGSDIMGWGADDGAGAFSALAAAAGGGGVSATGGGAPPVPPELFEPFEAFNDAGAHGGMAAATPAGSTAGGGHDDEPPQPARSPDFVLDWGSSSTW